MPPVLFNKVWRWCTLQISCHISNAVTVWQTFFSISSDRDRPIVMRAVLSLRIHFCNSSGSSERRGHRIGSTMSSTFAVSEDKFHLLFPRKEVGLAELFDANTSRS